MAALSGNGDGDGDGDGDLVILNPRRDDWDDSWEQRADDPRFSEQVSWELDMLDAADVVVMYFAPAPGRRSACSSSACAPARAS